MMVFRRIPSRPVHLKAPVAAIGIFDGVHRGHQAILRRAVLRAKAIRGAPMVVTFYPHPLAVLNPKLVPPLLLSLEQRLQAFESSGIRAVLVVPFTKAFSRWPAELFVRKLLVNRLQVREVVVGHDFGFGTGRSGSVETLREFGRRYDFKVHAIGPVKSAGERISSRRIRQVIRQGDLSQAARLLHRLVTLVGRVVRGSGRGRELGFPTANLEIEAGVLPPIGVYAVKARVGEKGPWYPAMSNIGFRPTFKRGVLRPLVEVHLFNLHRSLYGKILEVAFLKQIRSERCFPSAGALARQLVRDARRARASFSLYS